MFESFEPLPRFLQFFLLFLQLIQEQHVQRLVVDGLDLAVCAASGQFANRR